MDLPVILSDNWRSDVIWRCHTSLPYDNVLWRCHNGREASVGGIEFWDEEMVMKIESKFEGGRTRYLGIALALALVGPAIGGGQPTALLTATPVETTGAGSTTVTLTPLGWACTDRLALRAAFTPVVGDWAEITFTFTLKGATGSHPVTIDRYWNPGIGTEPEPVDLIFVDIDTAALGDNPVVEVSYSSYPLPVPDPFEPVTGVLTTLPVTFDTAGLSFPAGDGSRANPYQVADVENLRDIGCIADARHVVLTNDLDLTKVDIDPIGWPFRGNPGLSGALSIDFDGQGHTISNLVIDRPEQGDVGLFSFLEASEVRNLTLTGAVVNGLDNVGILVGKTNLRSTYRNISITNGTVTGSSNVGLVAGRSFYDTWTTLNVSGTATLVEPTIPSGRLWYLGGLFGNSRETRVEDAVVTATLGNGPTDEVRYVGGLVGNGDEAFRLMNIDATVAITLQAGTINRISGAVADDFGPGSFMRNSRLHATINLTSTDPTGRISEVGGFANQMRHSFLRDSEITGSITATTAVDSTNPVDQVGGVVAFSPGNNGHVSRVHADVNVTVNGSAKRVGALGGLVYTFAGEDLRIDGSVNVTGDAEDVGGLLGSIEAQSRGPRTSMYNVIWRGTRTVGGAELSEAPSQLWGNTAVSPGYVFGATFARGVFWQSNEMTPDPVVGDPATADQLATESFLAAAGYDTTNVWCVSEIEPSLRVIEPAACAVAPPAPENDPSAPTSPTAAQSGGGVTITVTPPASNPAISSYEYSRSTDNGATWTAWAPLTVSVPGAEPTDPIQFEITGLSMCASYQFKVRALNSIGAGAESSASTTLVMSMPAPGAPTNLVAAAPATKGSIMLTWTAPTAAIPTGSITSTSGSSSPGNSCAPIARYEYRSSINNGTTWSAWTSTKSTATSTTVSKLSKLKTYVFQVRAVNATGAGPASAMSNAIKPR